MKPASKFIKKYYFLLLDSEGKIDSLSRIDLANYRFG